MNRGLPVLDMARGSPEVAILGADQKERCLWGREWARVQRKVCCHVVNAFLSRLELIWPISGLTISEMSKECVFGKKL